MTLGTTHSSVSYDGNGSNRTFDVTFEFHAASDLQVILVTVVSGVERVQTQGFHYQVTGGDGELGQVYFMEPTPSPASGERVLIRRISSDLQPDDLVDGGALAAEPLERRLDIITARLQELETDIARSLKVTKGSQVNESALELNLTGGANKGISVTSDGQGVIVADSVLPSEVATSHFGTQWVNLAGPPEARSNLGLGTAALENIGTSGANVPLLSAFNSWSARNDYTGDHNMNGRAVFRSATAFMEEQVWISEGAISPRFTNVRLINQGSATTDNLDVINFGIYPIGSILILHHNNGGGAKTTVRHNAAGSGNIFLAGNADVDIDDNEKTLIVQRRSKGPHGAGWYEIARSFPFSTPVFQQARTSNETPLVFGGPSTFQFDFSPVHALAYLRCVTPELGYNQNDIVQLPIGGSRARLYNSPDTFTNFGATLAIRGPMVIVRTAQYQNNESAIRLLTAAGGWGTVTQANWRLFVRAWV